MTGHIHQINVSQGGVPKLAVERAQVHELGLAGDKQNDTKHHGGPERAVCLFSLEVIERLRTEGHPIAPGTVGENVTVAGIEWSQVSPGCRLVFEGGVELEVSNFTTPCSSIRESFAGLNFKRIKNEQHPGESRVYARVVRSGEIVRDERVRLVL